MTSAPLDESLDVRLRLTQLQEWQTEWYRIDRHLEEQVSLLDGNKLMELQQASHIANVRRRMEMTLVKTPLSIPERVLLHSGGTSRPGTLRLAICQPNQRRTTPLAQFLLFSDDHRFAPIR